MPTGWLESPSGADLAGNAPASTHWTVSSRADQLSPGRKIDCLPDRPEPGCIRRWQVPAMRAGGRRWRDMAVFVVQRVPTLHSRYPAG